MWRRTTVASASRPASCDLHLEALAAQRYHDELGDALLVVEDEHARPLDRHVALALDAPI